MSAVLSKFIGGYVTTEGVPEAEADAWAAELPYLGETGDYFFSSNEYVFTGTRP